MTAARDDGAACPIEGCGGATDVVYALPRFDVRRCRACRILFRHPFPDDAELRALYEDEAYHASAYFAGQLEGRGLEGRPEVRIYRGALERIAALVSPPAGERPALLDVGCGTGLFLALARERGMDVEGVELSESLSRLARERFGLTVACGRLADAALARAAYDAVTMWDLLEHVPDPVAVLRQARRLLRPGGVVVVFTINSASLFNAIGGVSYTLSARRWTRALELLYDPRHDFYFTRPTLGGVLRRARLVEVERETHRAHLGRWLSEPAPWVVRAAGGVIDLLSVALRAQYRQLVYCRDSEAAAPPRLARARRERL